MHAESFIWINGKQVQALDTADRGLAYGDGLFETMRWQDGAVALLDLHMQRLHEGCRVLGIDRSNGNFRAPLKQVSDQLRERGGQGPYVLKVIVSRGIGGQGYRPAANPSSPTVVARVTALQSDNGKTTSGVPLQLCRWRLALSPLLAGIKHLNRLEYVMAASELAGQAPEVQGLLTSANGDVVESLHHNVFIVKRGELITPRITMCGVKGVMRRHIIETLAPAVGLEVSERELSIDDLIAAQEIFLCNSVQGIWPVTEFRAARLQPGPITRQLQAQLGKLWRGYAS